MNEYLSIVRRELEEIEVENKERPPGDERARIGWIIERIRDMLIRAEIKQQDGRSFHKDMDQIEKAFKLI